MGQVGEISNHYLVTKNHRGEKAEYPKQDYLFDTMRMKEMITRKDNGRILQEIIETNSTSLFLFLDFISYYFGLCFFSPDISISLEYLPPPASSSITGRFTTS